MQGVLISLLVLVTIPISSVYAEILYVSQSGNGMDGSNWENAFTTISNAIEAATSGDEVWVASGTYNESVDFISGVSLYGGFIGSESPEYFSERDWKANETIIDGTGLNVRCVRVANVNNSKIDGFSICNAWLDKEFARTGGGIFVVFSDFQVKNCRIYNNFVGITSGTNVRQSGGGLYVINAFAEVSDCIFLNNRCSAFGGAIATNDDSFFSQTTLRLRNCFFDWNIGNAVTTTDTQVYVENCTFGQNNFQIFLDDYDDLDTIPTGGTAGATVTNCIIRSHVRGGTHATFSNILEKAGEGNIDVDPLWIDPENGDYRLTVDSPCIDTGTDVDVLTDLNGNPRPVDVQDRGIGSGFDMGAYEFQLRKSDLNQDGYVNAIDLIQFQEEWMREDQSAQE